MQTYSSLYQQVLDGLVKLRIESLRDHLEQPGADTEFLRGQIYMLRELNDIMEQAAEKAEQGNR